MFIGGRCLLEGGICSHNNKEACNEKCFSLLMDGSTDKSNIDNKLLLVLWCDPNGTNEKVHTRMNFLSIHKTECVTAKGLLQSLKHGLQCLGIQSVDKEACSRLVGIATDGAAVNIARNGLKGLVEKELEWIFWMWCLAQRLELAVKDALRGTTFDLKCSFVSTTSTRNLPRNADNWKRSSLI